MAENKKSSPKDYDRWNGKTSVKVVKNPPTKPTKPTKKK